MVNTVMVMGNLTKDVTLDNGRCKISIAIDKFEKGEKKVFYVEVRAFQKLAETCAHLKKGERVLVSGKLDCAEWEKDGKKHSMLYLIANGVEFLSPKAKTEEKKPDIVENPF